MDDDTPRDDEAAGFWRAVGVRQSHMHPGNKKDNFWEMGDTGPVGPCTEIHYDSTPDLSGAKLVNKGTADVIEIWNLVFIQFNRNADKSLTPLPAKHVDTGMGFERVTKVLQDKTSNYDTDVFTPIFTAIQKVTGAPAYTGKLDDLKDTAYRVIGDHIRTLTFALTDGAMLGNDGRNYVLKRILRRAERYGRQYFSTKTPFLSELVPSVVDAMGEVFPELKNNPAKVAKAIEDEEDQFIRTLDRGIDLFNRYKERSQAYWSPTFVRSIGHSEEERRTMPASFIPDEEIPWYKEAGQNAIPGQCAFTLHDTFGLYVDIVEQMAKEIGWTVDRAGYEVEMAKAKEKSRGSQKKHTVTAIQGDLPKTDDSLKYKKLAAKAKVIGWVKDNLVGDF